MPRGRQQQSNAAPGPPDSGHPNAAAKLAHMDHSPAGTSRHIETGHAQEVRPSLTFAAIPQVARRGRVARPTAARPHPYLAEHLTAHGAVNSRHGLALFRIAARLDGQHRRADGPLNLRHPKAPRVRLACRDTGNMPEPISGFTLQNRAIFQ